MQHLGTLIYSGRDKIIRVKMNGYQGFYCKVLLPMHSSDKDVNHMAGREKDSVIIRMPELLTVTSWVEDRMLPVTIEEVSLTPWLVC